jgi:superoxide dismutase, Cu-Zn family
MEVLPYKKSSKSSQICSSPRTTSWTATQIKDYHTIFTMKSATLVSIISSLGLASAAATTYPAVAPVKAVDVLRGTGAVKGLVVLQQGDPAGPTHITYNITGLTPGGEHGFHVHQSGDLSDGCASAGGHYNPFGKEHGAPTDAVRHVGDLGNIKAGPEGVSIGAIHETHVKLAGAESVIGRAIVVHEKADDLGKGPATSDTKKTGNAGGRPACGVIGLGA